MKTLYNILNFVSILPLILDCIKPLITTTHECPNTIGTKYGILISIVFSTNTLFQALTSTYISNFLNIITLYVLSDNKVKFLYLIFVLLLQLNDTGMMYVNMIIVALQNYNESKRV